MILSFISTEYNRELIMRIAMGVEYAGENFHGWQAQKDKVRTVQANVENALSQIANQPIKVVCAGRTDSGVHASGQVIHFDTDVNRTIRAWVSGGNANLPSDVNFNWATPVSDAFHARFKAYQRHYRYIINNRPTRSALTASRASWFFRPLDCERMQTAANHLLGEHDFSAYRAQACQAHSPVRTLTRLSVSRHQDQVFIEISANAFLQHMVRNIAGVLMAIGCGKADPDWSLQVLESRNRADGGVTALPQGLSLTAVDYPTELLDLSALTLV